MGLMYAGRRAVGLDKWQQSAFDESHYVAGSYEIGVHARGAQDVFGFGIQVVSDGDAVRSRAADTELIDKLCSRREFTRRIDPECYAKRLT